MLAPPKGTSDVEFDPTRGTLPLPGSPRAPLYQEEFSDGDGLVRCYSIYDLETETSALLKQEVRRDDRQSSQLGAVAGRGSEGPASRDRQLAGSSRREAVGRSWNRGLPSASACRRIR